MSAWRRLFRRRPYALALAGGLVALLAGDRAQLAPPPGIGIDPFEVLDQQVRNNVLIVLDTSGSMKWPVDRDDFTLGADDPGSRMFQAKQAIKAVVAANQNRVNFGLVSYNVLATDKNINETQDFEGDGRVDGPFVYVTADGTEAAPFFGVFSNTDDAATGGENEACTAIDGFWCRISATFANYDGTNSGDVWRSFMNRNGTNQANAYNNAYPAGCVNNAGQLAPFDLATPANMRCRYYIQSRLIRNGKRYTWNTASTNVTTRLLATTNITCPAPPAGLLGHTFTPPCFQMQNGLLGPVSTFYYTSAIYERQSGNACGGGALITAVAPCTGNNAPLVLSKMDPELPVTPAGQLQSVPWPPPDPPTGQPTGLTFDYGDGHLDGDQTTEFGLRADQSTPLAGTLCGIAGSPAGCTAAAAMAAAFPPPIAGVAQKNFVILVTDGDDTCANANTDRAAVLAGEAAELLYLQYDPQTQTGNFQRWAETLVVGFASAVNPARVNVIAQGGSGRDIVNGAATPAAAMAGPCRPGGACRDAFFASSTQQLIDILNAALEQATQTGFFSSTASVFDGVPEYVRTVPPSPSPGPLFDPMNPETRYSASAFRSYRSTFEAGTFRGFVRGFDDCGAMIVNAGRPSPCPSYPPGPVGPPAISGNWEAGQRLIDADRTSQDLLGTDHTFAEISGAAGGPSAPANTTIGAPGIDTNGRLTHIHRRIFTTRQNGRRLGSADDLIGATMGCTGGACRINLWPPDDAVTPGFPTYVDYATPGALDNRLFRKSDGTQMAITDLQAAPLKACLGNNLVAGAAACNSGTATVKLAAAQKEAREMIIAFTAGAEARRDAQGQPVRNAGGQIVYRRRNWMLAESTIGTPAVVIPPLQLTPTVHTQEYLLYRDGPRDEPSGQASGGGADTFLLQGFGLRHPDRDGKEVPVGTQTRPNLKPVMSVVYVPANDMLHAFRAGPCPRNPPFSATTVTTCQGEFGSEELWAFVPHDLLPSLKDKMKPQTRTDHTFMLAASLRFADVFLPGPLQIIVPGKTYNLQGRWRRLLLFGRGMGGKYYTALDITGVGSMTRPALQTKLPAVLWNRGNPDTTQGIPVAQGGTPVNGPDTALYADMGLTWSTPAIARVNANLANKFKEFVAYVGSGYSTGTNNNEGTRFYTLDPFNGDVIASDDVQEGLQPAFQNALVANPVIYSGERLLAGVDLPHPATPINESVFIGDIHGRLWKFDSNAPGTKLLFRNLGPDQPIGVSAALLNLGAPHVFVETGADARVPMPNGGFRMFGFKDAGPPYPGAVQVPPLSPPEIGLTFPPTPVGKGDYRGTLQPLTAFRGPTTAAEGVVFFTGTRFNPPGARCISTFDTVVFGLVANTGGAAYATTEYIDAKAVGLNRPPLPQPSGAPPPFDQGTAQSGQQPEPQGVKPSKVGTPATVKAEVIRPGSTVCREQ